MLDANQFEGGVLGLSPAASPLGLLTTNSQVGQTKICCDAVASLHSTQPYEAAGHGLGRTLQPTYVQEKVQIR